MDFMGKNFDKENHSLINVLYQRDRDDDGKFKDAMLIIYKNNETGEKLSKVIKNPEYTYYVTKPEYRNYDYNKAFIELEQVDPITCQYKNLVFDIADNTNQKDFVKRCIETRNTRMLKQVNMSPYVFASDISIESFYRVQWMLNYDVGKIPKLTRLYFDIEVDTIDINGFPTDGNCPINAVTLVDDESKTVFTLLLNNRENPLIADFVSRQDEFQETLHEMFDESYGELNYKIYMYDDELELIRDMFRLINTLKRDFALAWNGGGFDLPFIIERIKVLGGDPGKIMCHPDFEIKTCNFHKDTTNFNVANKGDSLKLASYTKFIDQMVLYGAVRKGQKEPRSYSLNFVGQELLKDGKLDYSEEANIKTLPYKNYWLFVLYNIKDVLLQMGIERKVSDIDTLFLRSYNNCVDYDKTFKQTVSLRSRQVLEFYKQGLVVGNNINVLTQDVKPQRDDDDEDDESFDGAVVGHPLLNSHEGIEIFGAKSKYVYNDVIDMD